jgi:hypothetical protein
MHHRGLHAPPEFKPNADKPYRDVGWMLSVDDRPSSGNRSGSGWLS